MHSLLYMCVINHKIFKVKYLENFSTEFFSFLYQHVPLSVYFTDIYVPFLGIFKNPKLSSGALYILTNFFGLSALFGGCSVLMK